MKSWMVWSSLALLCWGVYAFLPKLIVENIKPQSAIVYQVFGGLLVGVGMLFALNFKVETDIKGVGFSVATGFAAMLGALFYLKAATEADLALITPITALYPMVTIFLAAVFLHESIGWRQMAGLMLAIGAIWLMTGE